jgi:LPS-assembly protein
LPLIAGGGAWGTQIIEPIAQILVRPNVGLSQNIRYPNEDSLAFQFSDANLFSINRFTGIDRLEGGSRADVALRGLWTLRDVSVDGIFGQSYRTEKTDIFPVGSGLSGQVSDFVGRLSVHPASWLDLTYRTRLDKETLQVHGADALASVGNAQFRVTGGYLYSNIDPVYEFDQPTLPASYFTPRNELTLGASAAYGHWRVSGSARRDLESSSMVGVSADGAYENECLIFDVRFFKRYTSLNGDHGDTAVLFELTLKTVGQFGFHAL